MTAKQSILVQLKNDQREWGTILNDLQSKIVATIGDRKYRKYNHIIEEELKLTEDQDGIMFNGRYFDWKMFGTHKTQIVDAWLDYFPDNILSQVTNKIKIIKY